MTVYFMRARDLPGGPVKIGFSAKSDMRLAPYMAWSPFPLEIVAKYPGDQKCEEQFHALFRASRSHHEWFRSTPELERVIEAIRAGTFDPSELPDRGDASVKRGSPHSNEARALNRSLTIRLQNLGIQAPPDVHLASFRLAWMRGPEREKAVETIKRFLADTKPSNTARSHPLDTRAAEARRVCPPARRASTLTRSQ